MSAQNYPSIGFDPAPGKLDSVDDLTGKLTKAAGGLENAHKTLTGIAKGGKTWEGQAASAFAEKVGDLPKYLEDSRDALKTASAELGRWRTKLGEYQQKAREYETEAKAAKEKEKAQEAARDKAVSAYNSAAADPDLRLAGQYYGNQADLDSAQRRIDAASARLNTADKELDSVTKKLDKARDELEAILKKAEELLETHQADARTIADKLRKANDKAPDSGFFEGMADYFTKLGHDIQNWCTENADLLKTIGDWLGNIAGVLGVLSLLTLWCPPLSGAFALAGGVLSLGALAAHGAAKLGGANVSAMDLIGDGLGVIPFGKFAQTAVNGSVKVTVGVTRNGDNVIAKVDDVQKIMRMNRSTDSFAGSHNLHGEGNEIVGKSFKANDGVMNRVKLAWENHVSDNMAGVAFTEKRLSDVMNRVPGLRNIDSFQRAVRVDGTLDPMSWWSRGPLIGISAPGTVTGIYDSIAGKE